MTYGGPETLPLFEEPVEPGPLPEPVVPHAHPDRAPAAAPLTDAMAVDTIAHADEIELFYRRGVFDPDEHCAIWTGSISDDGYGTFSVTRGGRERTVKAHRFAVAYQLGIPVQFGQVIEHAVCDNPICVRPSRPDDRAPLALDPGRQPASHGRQGPSWRPPTLVDPPVVGPAAT